MRLVYYEYQIMKKTRKILAVFAHPDDESFGPSGTLAKYAQAGVEVHLLIATKGESGQNDLPMPSHMSLAQIRENEAIKASKIIGVSDLEFMGFLDGELKQNNYHAVAEKIMKKLRDFQPEVVVTFDNTGISGHIDHMHISMTTTYAFLKTRYAQKLYYHCLPEYRRKGKTIDDYFVYFPPGYKDSEITTVIDTDKMYDRKVKAMLAHESQIRDAKRIIKDISRLPKRDYFILKYHNLKKVTLPENDLFASL